jgi:N-acetyl-anhydromuramyl-L-alanine amidase AmpD
MQRVYKILVTLPLFLPLLVLPQITFASGESLQEAFDKASKEFNVPEDVLLSVSYNMSRWEDHEGKPSTAGGYGPMHLTDIDSSPLATDKDERKKKHFHSNDASLHTLNTVAKELNVDTETLKRDPAQNIRGGAYLLAKYAKETLGKEPTNEADWYAVVAQYPGVEQDAPAGDFADMVYDTMQKGEERTTEEGQTIKLPAKDVKPNKEYFQKLQWKKFPRSEAECPIELACKWAPAAYQQNNPSDPVDYGNYEIANREKDGLDIQYIVIHDTETPYAATINLFQDPTSYVSAHYVIRSSDGEITQMVKNKDVALHAGNFYTNMHSIGIEHEGYAVEGATWYTEFMYKSSARLARWLGNKYDIPLDRAHIIGHDDVPGPTADFQAGMHWDPGVYWDWSHYMELMGAPIRQTSITDLPGKTEGVVTINPTFAKNINTVKTCDDAATDLPAQSTSFVHLYTAPSFTAPLVDDPALAGPGTTKICDWGDKAATGQQFYRVERQNDWDAIYFGGQKAWFYNPKASPTASLALKNQTLITPKVGKATIPVFGRAYPEASAYASASAVQPIQPLQYQIPAGQKYVAFEKVKGDYYRSTFLGYNPSTTDDYVVEGQDEYYLIFFNHRLAYVKATDVDKIN